MGEKICGPQECQSALEAFNKRILVLSIPGRVLPALSDYILIAGRADFEFIN